MNDRQQLKGMVKGQYGDSIQSLPVDQMIHQKLAVGVTSTRADMTDAQIVRIATNVDAYIKFGDSTVVATANDVFFPAGVEILVMPNGFTHVAAIQLNTAGIATITKVGS